MIALLAIFAHVAGRYDANRVLPGQPSKSALRADFDTIPVAEGDFPVNEISTVERGGVWKVARNYSTTRPSKSVFDYYQKALPPLGWHLADTSEMTEPNAWIKFCKGAVSVILNTQQTGSRTIYYLGVGWTNHSLNDAFCPNDRPLDSVEN
ncbi:hypothetical protein [Dyella lipolytica]|uniref:Uncharacterized protein n=1 Tax=Dyella lipolytica TaxID=1867835 RepID=A0ABW8IY93_9GAMM|nr:hypothetical protein [Dyella lipolytica]